MTARSTNKFARPESIRKTNLNIHLSHFIEYCIYITADPNHQYTNERFQSFGSANTRARFCRYITLKTQAERGLYYGK